MSKDTPPKSNRELRRFPHRVKARITLEFDDKTRVKGHSVDISRNGLLAECSEVKPLNAFVRLKITLPHDKSVIEVFGRIARITNTEDKPRMGIHFMELAAMDREAWLKYMAIAESLDLKEFDEASLTKPDERRFEDRKLATYFVRFKDHDGMKEFASKNLSTGGMFLATPVLKHVGEKVNLIVVSPANSDDELVIEAVVAHRMDSAGPDQPKGMGLKFQIADAQTLEDINAFFGKTLVQALMQPEPNTEEDDARIEELSASILDSHQSLGKSFSKAKPAPVSDDDEFERDSVDADLPDEVIKLETEEDVEDEGGLISEDDILGPDDEFER